MADNDWKSRLGMVYSTNPDFEYRTDDPTPQPTLAPGRQPLRVGLDRRRRAGKQVTVIAGFTGTGDDLSELGRLLKTRLGVGGAAKEGEIIVQGDWCDRVVEILHAQGYVKAKKI
jgi:translation initiation factor 1